MKTSPDTEWKNWADLKGTLPEDQADMTNDWKALNNKIRQQSSLTNKTLLAAAAVLILLISSSLFLIKTTDPYTQRCLLQARKTIVLPDGSQVDLVRGSVLKYTDTFGADGLRQVKLTGEALFTVTADQQHPFIVDIGDAKIKVTGTTFMVSAFKSKKEVEVQVQSGKVLFYNSDTPSPDSFRVGLYAGDVGVYLPKLGQLNKKQLLSTP